jgi:hypothetical protein
MLTTDQNGYITNERNYEPASLETQAFSAGKIRAIAGGEILTIKQLANRLRISSKKALALVAVAQDGYDSIKMECE